ncbi:hypothetical protein DIPPA_25279 [Diplonema papillatum]|nr:hypothetical protein DIPPA_15077 [Diplonema papillatum]KAJ9457512.1 hypothetical protein DIPPA_25279 [Diplonema papillatum]
MGACCSTENSRATEHPPVRKPEDASKKPAASSKRIEDQPRGPVKQPAVPIEPLQPAPEEDSPQAFTSSYPGLNGDSTNRAPGDGSADGTLTLRQTTNSNDT